MVKVMSKAECVVCGSEFEKIGATKSCSADCRKARLKERMNAISRNWYHNNKEKVIESKKKWRNENNERHRETRKRYYENNRDRIREIFKQSERYARLKLDKRINNAMKLEMMVKECPHCGLDFKPNAPNQLVCSDQCRK